VTPKTQGDKDYFLRRGLELAKGFGFTTAIEGRAQRANHEAFKDAAARGLLDIDVLSYVDHADRAILDTEVSHEYRVSGLFVAEMPVGVPVHAGEGECRGTCAPTRTCPAILGPYARCSVAASG
jgi:hypothetical protein